MPPFRQLYLLARVLAIIMAPALESVDTLKVKMATGFKQVFADLQVTSHKQNKIR